MRFKLWVWKVDGLLNLSVQDTLLQVHQKDSWKSRDQSIYKEDAGRMVWKTCSYPGSVRRSAIENKAVLVAESNFIDALDPNMNWRLLKYILENSDGSSIHSVS